MADSSVQSSTTGEDTLTATRSYQEERSSSVTVDRLRGLQIDKPDLFRSPGQTRFRKSLWLVGFVVLVIGVVWGVNVYQNGGTTIFAGPKTVLAITVSSQREQEVLLDTSGYLDVRTWVKVNPRIFGTIVQINVEEGQHVNKGDVLAILDDRRAQAELLGSKAGLALAQAQLQELRAGAREAEVEKAHAILKKAELRMALRAKEFERSKRIKSAISAQEYDLAESTFREAEAQVAELNQSLRLIELGPRKEKIKAAEAEVERAKAEVELSQFQYDSTRITAPADGIVTKRPDQLGQVVFPETMIDDLFQIADFSQFIVEIEIGERDVGSAKLGQSCLITPEAFPDREYRGELTWIAPRFNRQRGIRRAKVALVEPGTGLFPDMACRVRVFRETDASETDRVLIPLVAVTQNDDGAFVFILDGDRARRRSVELGEANDTAVEISSGLQSGDVVLVPSSGSLTEDEEIQPRMVANPADA